MDLVIRSERLPAPGETLLGGVFATFPGGKGANQAVAAARLGARVQLVGCVGQDPNAAVLLAGLRDEGVDTAGVTSCAAVASGVALISVDAAGENTIVVASGANAELSTEMLEQHADILCKQDWLLAQLETPLEVVQHGLAVARAAGVRTALNAAPAAALPREFMQGLDLLIANRGEAAMIAGLPSDAPANELLGALHALGPAATVITLGSAGSIARDPAGEHVQAAFPVRVLDTVGAGDCFAGALVVALAEGAGLRDGLRFASAAAALATTRAGAQSALPRREEVATLLA